MCGSTDVTSQLRLALRKVEKRLQEAPSGQAEGECVAESRQFTGLWRAPWWYAQCQLC
jgi:hypothetical protein